MFRGFVLISVLVCASGEKFPRLEGRIVGGEETTIEEFPYQVALFHKGAFFCGGCIISETVIVTAGHCVEKRTDEADRLFTVLVGSSHLDEGERSRVKEIIIHEDYDDIDLDNDIALVILAKALQFSDSIKPIPLAESGEEATGIGYVSGWGAINIYGPSSQVLQHVALTITDPKVCNAKYKEIGFSITESMICAGVGNGKGACIGDSGGPLISEGKLIGIVSWVVDCRHYTFPGVFARISYLRDWIDKNSPDK